MATENLKTNALIDVEDAEKWLEIGPGQDNERLIDLINSISELIEKYTNRYYVPRALTEVYSGDGTNELLVKYAPIVELSSAILVRDRDAIPVDDIFMDVNAGILHAKDRFFIDDFMNITVAYTAGYGTVAEPAIPDDIKHACRDTVAYYWKRDFVEYTAELKQALVGLPQSAFPTSAKCVVDNYRRIPLG